MALVALLTLCALPAVTHQLAYSSLQSTELAAEKSADSTFAGARSLLDTLQADITHLEEALRGPRARSLVQLTSETAPQAHAGDKAPAHKKIDATTAVQEMAKLKPNQMAPMLGLLTGMYDSWKDKIGEANKHEAEQKKEYEKTIAGLEKKKAQYKDNKDAQATYDRIEKYWKRQRSIAHRQYHTALKIMHSGMQKFKAVSQAMDHAVHGKKPTAEDLRTVGMAMPDVVFLQTQVQRLAVWTQGAKNDLHGAEEFVA